jgi:hypothetical protein
LVHRVSLDASARLATTIEFDYLVKGRQTSTLSDFNPAFADVTNDQRNGYGIRASMVYEKGRWMFGPWLQYWNATRSDPAPLIVATGGTYFIVGTAFEPKNKTTEIGLRLGYRY